MARQALGPGLIVVDTSAAIAAVDVRDRHHAAAASALATAQEKLIIPAGVMAEIAYFFEKRFGVRAIDAFLGQIESGYYVIDCGDGDVTRIRALVNRYASLPLGYADASVIACAERLGGRVLTFDHHFRVVSAEGTFSVVP